MSCRVATPSDIKITPHDNVALGSGLFDRPATLFAVEIVLFFGGLWAYTQFAPLSTKTGYKNNMNILKAVSAFMVIQQAHFCFGSCVASSSGIPDYHNLDFAEHRLMRRDGFMLPRFYSRSCLAAGPWESWRDRKLSLKV